MFYVINSKGEKEPFSLEKVYKSVLTVGASKGLARKIASVIEKDAYSGIKTSDIFQEAKRMLSQDNPAAAVKFNLKTAMRALGPAGFNFEKYIAAIFKKSGYAVKLNQFISGACLNDYEIDFLAQKEKTLKVGECKYHNLADYVISADVALANYARFLDLQKGSFLKNKICQGFEIKSILVTNTKFSARVIKYCQSVEVELLGWKYPFNQGLERLIGEHNLYPITILPSFKQPIADIFTQRGLILARDILDIDVNRFAQETKISLNQVKVLIKETQLLY